MDSGRLVSAAEAKVIPLKRTQPAGRRHNQYGEPWEQAYERVHRDFPSTRDASWVFNCPESLLFRLIGDLIRPDRTVEELEVLEGEELDQEVAEARRALGTFFDQSHTTLPFREALEILAGDLSTRELSEKVDINRTRMHRLRNGDVTPGAYDFELIANAYGKDPRYFVEYRALIISRAVWQAMHDNPDRSAVVARRMIQPEPDSVIDRFVRM